jgi:hypothetical protein
MADAIESYQDNRPADGQINHFGVEHMLGVEFGALIKVTIETEMRQEGDTDLGPVPTHIWRSLLTPTNAREIANNLLLCAARAEYEADLVRGLESIEMDKPAIASIVMLVRRGEIGREQTEIV